RRQSNKLVAACVEERTGGDCQRRNALLRDDFECGVDLAIRVGTQNDDRQIHCTRRLLDIRELALGRRETRIQEKSDGIRPWHKLAPWPEAFGLQLIGQEYDPGGITTRPVEACHETLLDRIATSRKDNWNGRTCRLRRERGRFAAGRRNYRLSRS